MRETGRFFMLIMFPLILAVSESMAITPAERAELAYKEGQKLELEHNFVKAAEYYLESVEQDKKNSQYHYKLAYVYTQLKPPKIREAIDRLKQLVKMDPGHKAAYSLLGKLYFRQSEIEKAEEAFECALKIDSQFAEPHFFLGEIWQKRAQEQHQAIAHYQAYLRLANQGEFIDTAQEHLRELLYGNSGTYLTLAIAAMRNREYDRALLLLNRLLQTEPASLPENRLKSLRQEVHYWRGLLYSNPEAHPHYDSSGAKSEREWLEAPDAIAARIELGNWYYQIGEIQDAIGHLEAAIRLDSASPSSPVGPYGGWLTQRVYFYLGKAYMEASQKEEALAALQKAQTIDPEGDLVSEARALCDLLSGKAPVFNHPPEAILGTPDQWEGLERRFISEYGQEIRDVTQQRRLENILTRILTASSIKPFGSYPYSIVILENPAATAWSLPGGQIFVSTGLLHFVRTYLNDSDDVLAFIIGHELAHLVNRDIQRSQEGIQVIESAFAGGKLPMASFQHGLSRIAELRADKDGALLAYRAKFDPADALEWCEAMISEYGDIDPNGRYPTFKERRERLKWFLTAEMQVAYARFNSGLDAFRKGDYAAAAENFQGYLSYFPYDKYALNNLGIVYHQHAIHKAGGSPHGEWRLKVEIEVRPDLIPLRVRGMPPGVGLDKELLMKSIQQFEAALRVDRHYKVAYKGLGDVYADLDDFDRANDAYQDALHVDPEYAEVKNSLGVLLCHQKLFEDGIRVFQDAFKIANNNLDVLYNLALAYEFASQTEKAQTAWRTYLKFDDESRWADKARSRVKEH